MNDQSLETPKGGQELIIYQIGELKALLTSVSTKQDNYQDKIDKRVSALEIWKAGQEEKEKATPKAPPTPPLDITKIVLGAFGIVSAALAVIASIAAGWFK